MRALIDGEQHTAREIAAKELLPLQFTYKILKKLSRAKLVHVGRGVEGGSRLVANLETVSLYDLMTAMDGNRNLISCLDPEFDCPWRAANGTCAIHCQLRFVQHKLDEELKSHSLQSLFSTGS